MNRKGKGDTNWVAVTAVTAIILVVLGATGIWDVRTLIPGSGVAGGDNGGDDDGDSDTPAGCNFQTSIEIDAIDQEDSSKVISAVKYKVGDGAVKTDADGAFNVKKGETLSLLLGYNNGSTYTPIVRDYTVDECGLNTVSFNDMVANTSVTIQCFNEEGNVIDDSGENETIGTGEAPTLECEIRGVAKKGFPLGGVLTAEFSKSAYDESNVEITGLGAMPSEGIYGDPVTQALSAYEESATGNTVKAVEVAPMLGAGVIKFNVYLPAEDDQNPGISDDVTLKFYPAGGYEEEDVSGGEFRQGITDMDNTFVRSPAGTTTIHVD